MLGLPSRFYVITTAMYQLVSQYPPRFPLAAAMRVSLFAVMFGMVYVYRRLVRAKSFVTITGIAQDGLLWPFARDHRSGVGRVE